MNKRTSANAEQSLRGFRQLLADRQKQSTIVTKEEAARRARDQETVKLASTYTVSGIVKGLADLQLTFDAAIDELADTLTSEASKLEQIRQAIEVETGHLQELSHIEAAAAALDVLTQEQAETASALEAQSAEQLAALEHEMAAHRQAWQQEAKEHELESAAYEETLHSERTQAEADFAYKLERKRQVELDEFEAEKRTKEREIATMEREKQKEWAARAQAMETCREELDAYKVQVETFTQKLDEATQRARDEALQAVAQEAQLKTDLLEKEIEANARVRELQIEALEETVARQVEQIQAISAELGERLKQAQDLASQAISSSSGVSANPATQAQG